MLAEFNLFVPLLGTLFLGLVLVWLYALLDCLRRDDFSTRERIAWAIVILCGNYLGLIAYYAFCNRAKRQLARCFPKALDPVTGKPQDHETF